MKALINSSKNKINSLNFWFKNSLAIVIISILVNHLFEPENFPLNEHYKFPLFPIIVSIFSSSLILLIAKINFNYFKHKYFSKKINIQLLFNFLFSTLGYITLLYIILYFGFNGLINGIASYRIYNLLTGLSISLLISTLGITLLFSTDIYKLHKSDSPKSMLRTKHSGIITLVDLAEIAFIYSENKIVYIIKTDKTSIITDFTLNEVESKINERDFFRANRQVILHSRSVEQVQSIENGKLSVSLKPITANEKAFKINISRYKKQEFMTWFNNTL